MGRQRKGYIVVLCRDPSYIVTYANARGKASEEDEVYVVLRLV